MKVLKFRITDTGTLLLYGSRTPRDTQVRDVSELDGTHGDFPLDKVKINRTANNGYSNWGSYLRTPEGVRKDTRDILANLGIETFGQLVAAGPTPDVIAAFKKGSEYWCSEGDRVLRDVLTSVAESAPHLVDPNYVAPVVIPLGLDKLILDPGVIDDWDSFDHATKSEIQSEIRTYIQNNFGALVNPLLVQVRKRQVNEAMAALEKAQDALRETMATS